MDLFAVSFKFFFSQRSFQVSFHSLAIMALSLLLLPHYKNNFEFLLSQAGQPTAAVAAGLWPWILRSPGLQCYILGRFAALHFGRAAAVCFGPPCGITFGPSCGFTFWLLLGPLLANCKRATVFWMKKNILIGWIHAAACGRGKRLWCLWFPQHQSNLLVMPWTPRLKGGCFSFGFLEERGDHTSTVVNYLDSPASPVLAEWGSHFLVHTFFWLIFSFFHFKELFLLWLVISVKK